jgi:sortase A
MVLEGVEDEQLQLGAGHVPETAFPGERGNVGIAGHRDTFFRPLREIQEGDVITLRTLEGIFRYRVESTWITEPDDVAVLESGSKSTLTLVTCHPFSYIGPAPDRFIVRAVSLEEE